MKNTKKYLATTLALLSVVNTFTPAQFLDLTPRANAWSPFSKTNFKIKTPTEYEKVTNKATEILNSGNCPTDQHDPLRIYINGLSQGTTKPELPKDYIVKYKDESSYSSISFLQNNPNLSSKDIAHHLRKHLSKDIADLAVTYLKCVCDENGLKYKMGQSLLNLLRSDEFEKICEKFFPHFSYNISRMHRDELNILGIFTNSSQNRYKEKVCANEFLADYMLYNTNAFEDIQSAIDKTNMLKMAPFVFLAFGLSNATGVIKGAGTILKNVTHFSYATVNAAYKRFIYNRKKIGNDSIKLRKLLSEFLNETVLKQENAIDQIIDTITGMTSLWNQHDRNGTECTCACTMTFMGDSGVGKTWAARMISKAIFGQDMQPWQFVTSTSITNTTATVNGQKLSPADQIFNTNSELVRQLTRNPRVVIVFDEIDKMHKWDPDDSVLERLRDARDTGKLLVKDGVNQYYIDVSRTVFICITNELRECWGLPKNENLSPQHAAARTYVKRDQSLVNRFEVVEFKDFDKEDYKFFLTPFLEEVKKEFLDIFNLDLIYSDEFIDSIATASESKNKGVRGVNDYMILLRGSLIKFIEKNQESLTTNNKKDPAKQVNISYDIAKNEFNINLAQ